MTEQPVHWYVGDRDQCPIHPGDERIAWDETPTPEQLGEIRWLALRPSPAQILPAQLHGWIAELPRCRELELPIQHLAGLRNEHLPVGLEALIFRSDYRWTAPDGSHVPAWPDALISTDLRRLGFTNYMSGAPAGFRPEHAPALQALTATLDKRGEVIDRMVGFPRLRELELFHVGNHDVFESLDGAIEVLALHDSTRRFPFAAILRWPTLERLDLWHMKCEVDCRILSELPELRELQLMYCKRVVDIEALLDCPRLRALTLEGSERSLTPALHQAFVDHGFDRLEIGWP